MRLCFLVVIASFAACTSTYHPEFHPVSVSHVVVTGQTPVKIQQTPVTNGVPFEFVVPEDVQ